MIARLRADPKAVSRDERLALARGLAEQAAAYFQTPEAAALLDAPHARTEKEMLEQGRALLGMGCGAVLMKGGHLDDAESPDWLFTRDGEQRFTAPRVQTKNTHGTGCTLSAALAALRPRYDDWGRTVAEAKGWLSAALAQADSLEVGHGIGPVHHFHAWW